jgi:hypothetical protein
MIGLEEKGRFFGLRQWLNVMFILLSIAGMTLWFYHSREMGGIVLITAVGFKFIELTLRIMKM